MCLTFFHKKRKRGMDMKDNRTELQKVKSEIEIKENEREKYEKKLV